ncbi:LutC/YkgG family protein [Arhodomonas sp. AD133]|uniref:LutC/YkgG family protein n=1 Tax=Arhodomonas sp. AD133 TaxID=3415009 RepID=UPI003EC109C8
MTDRTGHMLATIRQALGRETAEDPERIERERAAMMATAAPRPVWDDTDTGRFLTHLESAAGTWQRLESPASIPTAVAGYLGTDTRASVRVGRHEILDALTWPEGLDVATDIDGARHATATVTVAHAGVAETGTLVFAGSPASPTSFNFLPEHHFAVLYARDVVPYMEDAWKLLQSRGTLPRAVNFITGPSRTGDVEQTIELGAHGPRSVHVFLIE